MQPILDHIARRVRPALRNYIEAEHALTRALETRDAATIDAARDAVDLAGRQAVDLLHHLADYVFEEKTVALPAFADMGAVRAAIDGKCEFLRNGQHVDDVDLLRDVAVAFKHHRPKSGRISSSNDIAPGGVGFGQCRWGEGKYGGVEQIIVATKTGDRRALSSVMQNVFDAWMNYLGQPLPPISRY
ncbi:hypothetical protein C2U70_23830 [Bradyrhizobium guangdongense]|uniref:hypothetical protein n=1 Tax=Bradyrhizobium guangdongense TaxID=1325090 RepID=UPI00112C1876|nr:hypothetical protein [Bradyrhizobium guangdongense]TPQ31532.1 hypothetical protein C2U70_23830 [Bradyrhizobium guangdongense]